MLEFDIKTHTYRLDGRPVPGVTGVLTAVGLSNQFYTGGPTPAEFGQEGHRLVRYVINKTIDDYVYDPAFAPWMAQIVAFVKKYNPVPLTPDEAPVVSRKLQYAGTMDFVGYLHDHDRGLWILDWKFWSQPSRQALASAGLQTAAYSLAWREMGGKDHYRRGAVWFGEENFKLYALSDPADETTWRSALNTYRFREKHNLLEREVI